MLFIDYITESMEKQGITAYKLCKDLGMSQQTFSNWKSGKIPALDKAITIIKYLGLSADEIFEIKNRTLDITQEDIELLKAYQLATPGRQEAVRALLNLPDPKKKLSNYPIGKNAL